MRLSKVVAVASICTALFAQDLASRAWDLEKRGDAAGAERLLRQTAAGSPESAAAQRAYAEFLERHRSPDARTAYEKLASVLERTGAAASDRAAVQRRLAALDLLSGDRAAATRRLVAYSSAPTDTGPIRPMTLSNKLST